MSRNTCFLTEDISRRLVRSATIRLEKSAVMDFVGQNLQVDGMVHSQLELGERLGQGSFSSVYEIKSLRSKGQKKYDADKLVVKVLRSKLTANPPMLAACAADLVKEGMIMAALNHRNILSVRAWQIDGIAGYSNGRHDAFFLVLDRLEETLSDRLQLCKKQQKKISRSLTHRSSKRNQLLKERLDVLLQLSDAIKYIHSRGILHRDLKPDNIGFDRDGVLKVFDFDVSCVVPESSVPDETFLLSKRVGSPRYISPECARGEQYNLKADVYTFGLLCHELISLEKPYDEILSGFHDELVFHKGVRPYVPTSWPKEIQTLLHRSWSEKVAIRPTMEEAHRILEREIPLYCASKFESKEKVTKLASKESESTTKSRAFNNKLASVTARYFRVSRDATNASIFAA
jgi:serine/threonine protein kinase